MAEVEPRPEVNERDSTAKKGDLSSESSELGESEAYDEEEEGVMDDDDE
jgi:peroxin-2